MAFLTELWLPIVLSAVVVFVASSIIHMAIPIHKSDYKKMNNEASVLEAMRSNGVVPGMYMFPCAESMKDMGTPEMQAKMKQGPIGWMTVLPSGGFNIGPSLIWWFVFSLIVGALTAYAGWYGLGASDDAMRVFRVTGVAAVLGYAIGHFHDSIWKGQRWGVTGKFIFDGVVYGLLTAATFTWLWPDA